MKPLAERMRPKLLADIIGQQHLIGHDGILRKTIAKQQIPSCIFWGPPGVGKTTLAQVIAAEIRAPFFQISAINSGVKEIREVIENARQLSNAILFIDEIHRFSKSQQDALLAAVEHGTITLIGATTENPSFEVNNALLSRCQVYTLTALTKEQLLQVIQKAIQEDIYLAKLSIVLQEVESLIKFSNGDARKMLNLLEITLLQQSEENANNKIVITNEAVAAAAQQQINLYDKNGEQHYDIISAFIKSIRGSDPNAAVYWLARMIDGGEDVKFIARRLLILASEDIGNANPNALLMANTCFDAVQKIGFPESRIILSQCVIYLSTSVKSNASYLAINQAQALVKKYGNLPVPMHLRNAPTALMKKIGYGENYAYSHDFENNFSEQEYLPEAISNTTIYQPGSNQKEIEIRKFLAERWKQKYGY